jgi:MFS superfamily sulfate permease-like transporter
VTEAINRHNFYKQNLKTVGTVKSGINILRQPTLKYPFGDLLVDVIPLTLIAFMESYSVARKMAAIRNELHILNASQELWAVGVANLLGSVSSAYPVAGSFSRSSLNLAAGARTPLSKAITLCVVLLTLGLLTDTFYYIPQAALAAVIMASISSLIDLRDFWNAWKYSKKDFFIMLFTAAITFIFDTKWGLLAGIGGSFFLYIGELAFFSGTGPQKFYSNHSENGGIEVVTLESDLVFVNSARIKDFLTSLITLSVDEFNPETANKSDVIFHKVLPHETIFLDSTEIVNINWIKHNPYVKFQTWDFGGGTCKILLYIRIQKRIFI